MAGRLAYVTGAARGQGRSHCGVVAEGVELFGRLDVVVANAGVLNSANGLAGGPNLISDIVVWLASDGSSLVTAAQIPADKGYLEV